MQQSILDPHMEPRLDFLQKLPGEQPPTDVSERIESRRFEYPRQVGDLQRHLWILPMHGVI